MFIFYMPHQIMFVAVFLSTYMAVDLLFHCVGSQCASSKDHYAYT